MHPGGIKTAIARNATVSGDHDATATANFFDRYLARMTSEDAADVIINGVRKNKTRILVGTDAEFSICGCAGRLEVPVGHGQGHRTGVDAGQVGTLGSGARQIWCSLSQSAARSAGCAPARTLPASVARSAVVISPTTRFTAFT